ncbi:MAG: hypothetical protein CYPHOPRED_003562 [Cyphobasidiales sp. Tagirdzhanova-0007]|nr:MAG: hypothetical protein CYPHOPRED_003562 [Cyphobasidiales sp. Tagirdzhanova-0007]
MVGPVENEQEADQAAENEESSEGKRANESDPFQVNPEYASSQRTSLQQSVPKDDIYQKKVGSLPFQAGSLRFLTTGQGNTVLEKASNGEHERKTACDSSAQDIGGQTTGDHGQAFEFDRAEAPSNEPYDPYVSPTGSAPSSGGRQPGSAASGGRQPGSAGSTGEAGSGNNARTAAIQAEIDNTVNIMQDNIKKVAERGERLESLQDKTDTLAVSAQGFRRGANRVRKAMWWKDMKMRLLIGAGIIILIILIVVPIVVKEKK